MTLLKLYLVREGKPVKAIQVLAEDVMEVNLKIAPGGVVGLPKLISVVNMVEKINNEGFELIGDGEVNKIAALITKYYIPNPMDRWTDQILSLETQKIPSANAALYDHVSDIRNVVRDKVRATVSSYYEPDLVNLVRHEVAEYIQSRVQNKSASWRTKLLEILLQSGVSVLVDSFVGIPLHTLVMKLFSNL